MPSDLFISYADEDQDFAGLLVAGLYMADVRSIRFDEAGLRPGDSLRESLEQGLNDSRYGLVLCTKHYFADNKPWTADELGPLFSLPKRLVLICHEVSAGEMQSRLPFLADVVALQSGIGMKNLVGEITAILRADRETRYHETWLFWFLAEHYVKKLIGDLPPSEQNSLDAITPDWEAHVRKELGLPDATIETVFASIKNAEDDQELIARTLVILKEMVR
jgi:hypothetical protein